MKSIYTHDFIRKHLFVEREGMKIEDLKVSEWSESFEKLMRNRLIIGAFRYGKLHDPNKKPFDRLIYICTKLDRYQATGNLEALVDVANLALLEFEESKHPKRHFSRVG